MTKNPRWRLPLMAGISMLLLVFVTSAARADDDAADSTAQPPKTLVAVFPLGGDAPAVQREKIAFALRAKLERDNTYDVVQGPDMDDAMSDAGFTVDFATAPKAVSTVAAALGAKILIWGELKNLPGADPSDIHATLRLHVLDLRDAGAKPTEITQEIGDGTRVRFATEQVLETLPGIKPFEHPNEEAVHDDATSRKLWVTNPNLCPNPDFDQPGQWDAIYQSEKYPVSIGDSLPAVDKVNIYRMPAADGKPGNVLAMRLSLDDAQNNGMACLSDEIPIKPGRRYRVSFRYMSDGPVTHVFVKGYRPAPNIQGKIVNRECFRTQVSPTGGTAGKWETVIADVDPIPGTTVLRVDLYAYLNAGHIYWDDVTLKEVGKLQADPDAQATTRPNHPGK